MRHLSTLGLVFATTVLLGIGAPKTASALICCSACDEDPTLPPCRHGCSPSCVADEPPAADPAQQDDEDAQLCYAQPTTEAPVATDDAST